jgi:hypothetical protein
VYLGDSSHLRSLLPDPLAVIYVDDFLDIQSLSNYLNYLLSNETAYEQHRRWRQGYSLSEHKKSSRLLENSWQCQVCNWAAEQYHLSQAQGYTLAADPCLTSDSRTSIVEEKHRRKKNRGRII